MNGVRQSPSPEVVKWRLHNWHVIEYYNWLISLLELNHYTPELTITRAQLNFEYRLTDRYPHWTYIEHKYKEV